MTNEFFDWLNLVVKFFEKNSDIIQKYGYSLEEEISLDEQKSSFIRVNLDSDIYLAQLLLTEVRYLHIEILDFTSEETLLSSRILIGNQIHLWEELSFLLSRVNPQNLKQFYE
jgi:hypothetical protein